MTYTSDKNTKRDWRRPLIHGDIWDRMTTKERDTAWRWDLIIGFGGTALIYLIGLWVYP